LYLFEGILTSPGAANFSKRDLEHLIFIP